MDVARRAGRCPQLVDPRSGGSRHISGLFRSLLKSQSADRELDDFMTVPRSRLPPHHQVHRRLGGDVLLHSVAERGKVDVFEQGLALAEQDRRDGEVYLVE